MTLGQQKGCCRGDVCTGLCQHQLAGVWCGVRGASCGLIMFHRLVLAMHGCRRMLHLQQQEHLVQTGRSSCKSVELRVAAGCVTIAMAAMRGAYCSLLGLRGGVLQWEHFLHAVAAVQCHGISLGGRCRVINTGHISLGVYAMVGSAAGRWWHRQLPVPPCVGRTSMRAGMHGSQWQREPVIPDDRSVFAESAISSCDTWKLAILPLMVVRGADGRYGGCSDRGAQQDRTCTNRDVPAPEMFNSGNRVCNYVHPLSLCPILVWRSDCEHRPFEVSTH